VVKVYDLLLKVSRQLLGNLGLLTKGEIVAAKKYRAPVVRCLEAGDA